MGRPLGNPILIMGMGGVKLNAWVPTSAGGPTSSRAEIYTDPELKTPASNPYKLGPSGHATLYRHPESPIAITITDAGGGTTYHEVHYPAVEVAEVEVHHVERIERVERIETKSDWDEDRIASIERRLDALEQRKEAAPAETSEPSQPGTRRGAPIQSPPADGLVSDVPSSDERSEDFPTQLPPDPETARLSEYGAVGPRVPAEIAELMEPGETFSQARKRLTELLNVELAELKNLRGVAGQDLKREAQIEFLLGLFARVGEI